MLDALKPVLRRLDEWTMRHRTARVTRVAVSSFAAHEGPQYAGSMAYFAVLSIFQLLVLGVVAASLVVGEGAARRFVVEQVSAASPIDAETISDVIDAVIDGRGGITAVGLVLLAWGALGVFGALTSGIGHAFEAEPKRGFLADKLLGLFLMALTGALAVASVIIGILTGIVQAAAAEVVAAVPGGSVALSLIGVVLPFGLILLAFGVLYRVVPNRPLTLGDVLPGALVAAVLWTALRLGFTYYATQVARYDSAFGPISTAISLLVFLYFASLVVLLGAEVVRATALDRHGTNGWQGSSTV
jgi:membrane protein